MFPSYKITYRNVGTNNAIANPITYTVATLDITLDAPTDSVGYTFRGWYTDALFTDTVNTPAITAGDAGDIVFYAKWTIEDSEGNSYKTVKIGNQVWMGENLRATKFAIGTLIPKVTTAALWGALGDNNSDKAYCYYNNDSATYSQTYGVLYTYATATNGTPHDGVNNVQGVCPTGWHIPSKAEWSILESYLESEGFYYPGNVLKTTYG